MLTYALTIAGLLGATATAQAQSSGTFSLLTFNVAGLPSWLGDNGVPGEKATNAATIGARLAATGYDFVNLQEDFGYNRQIYGADTHPFRTATKGNVPFGDGLSTLANYNWTAGVVRHKWEKCSIIEADCLTPKGFSWLRAVVEGAEVDIYNLHADAGDTDWDDDARSAGIDQLLEFINANSQGKATILAGDFNDRWTMATHSINRLIDAGFTDSWVSIIRNGEFAIPGSDREDCATPSQTTDCETIDKVFYRSGDSVSLEATSFRYPNDIFIQDDGNKLSDHNPVLVEFSWSSS